MGCVVEQLPKPLRSPLRSSWPLRYGIAAAKGGGAAAAASEAVFPVIMMYGVPLRMPLRLSLAAAIRIAAAVFCFVFPLQGLSCG